MLDRKSILPLLPHAGSMVLLDGVVSWTDRTIHCVSRSHRDPANPLRERGSLAAVHALEYLAQAAAVHGGLMVGGQAPLRVLAAFRDVRLAAVSLDRLAPDLEVIAERYGGDDKVIVYAGTVHAGGAFVASGRLTLVTPSEARP
jgi:predicted hotdog family 3-hydroxylacyl-ACP dehydratase